MKFKRRKGFQIKTNPQVVGEYCYQLEQKKGCKLTPKELVEAARDIDSPLHNEFEWNDTKAAQKYREWQARYIISSIELEIINVPNDPTEVELEIESVEEKPIGVKFYHALESNGTGYENVLSIATDEEKHKKLLENCLKDAESFREKYDTLRGTLPALFNAIDDALNRKVS
jgi:hypothetical protein